MFGTDSMTVMMQFAVATLLGEEPVARAETRYSGRAAEMAEDLTSPATAT
jgi:hypothetical protein